MKVANGIKSIKGNNSLIQKQGAFKKISYLKPLITSTSYKKAKVNDNHPNANASDAMVDFFKGYSQASKCNYSEYQPKPKNAIRFKSNQIADKEISIIRNRKDNSSYMEALINKSIDYTLYHNTSLFGKSMLDFSLSQSKSKRTISKDNMKPFYESVENEKQNESKITFKYGSDAVNLKTISIAKVGVTHVKQEQNSLHSAKKNIRPNNKESNQKKQGLIIKTNYINEKSKQKSHHKTAANKTGKKIKSTVKVVTNQGDNEDRQRCNQLEDYENVEEEKEEVYPFTMGGNGNDYRRRKEDQKSAEYCDNLKSNKPETSFDQQLPLKDSDGLRDEEDYCNVDNSSLDNDNCLQATKIYQFKPISTMNDLLVKTEIEKAATTQQYNSIVSKYLFSEPDDKPIDSKALNDPSSSQIDKDIEEVTLIKKKMLQIEQYYSNQIQKMQYDMNQLNTSKSNLDDSIISKSSLSQKNKEDNVKAIMTKLESFERSLTQKEHQFKSIIQSLIDELKDSSKAGISVSLSLLQEANDFLNEADYISKEHQPTVSTDSNTHPSHISLQAELEQFKKEEALYSFDIPLKYQMGNRVKCIKEQAIKGKLVRFYENSIIDVIDKKKTTKRIFPDGYEIWYYSNKDMQQRSPSGRLMFYYHKNKSYEFRFMKEKFLVYKFSSGQYEKHYFDNSKSIKFADGSFRITRPNGEELIQFTDGTIRLSKNDKGKARPI